jgi:hypothetical protein
MKHTLPKFIVGFILLAFVFNSCFKDELKKEIDDLRGQLTTMQKKNDSLNNVLNVRADSLSKALSAAQKRSDSLSNILKTKSDSLSNALGITNANLAALSKSVDSIKTQITSINGQLTQLNSQLASLTTQLNLLNQQLAAIGGNVSQLAAQYQTLSASLETINSQILALQVEQQKLLDKLNAILLQLNPPIVLIATINQSFSAAWNFSWTIIPGRSYLFKIKGLYSDGGGANNLDAAFDLRNSTPYNTCSITNQSRWRFINNCSIRPRVDSVNIDHIYEYVFTPTTSTMEFDFKDCCYGDNSGQLTFELYEIK